MHKKLHAELINIFSSHANPIRAASQQAYMKSSMPFWGIAVPKVRELAKPLFKMYAPVNNDQYRAAVLYLFQNAQYREQWYAALLYARSFKQYITAENSDLYIEIIRIGQWWDIVDEVSVHLIGKALYAHAELEQQLTQWIADDNFWVRRVALLTQLQYKSAMNFKLLEQLIVHVAHEKEFFIRKAIGWVLREYSTTNPQAVVDFVNSHSEKLSPLSKREALRLVST